MGVHGERGLVTEREAGRGPRRDQHAVADTCDVDDDVHGRIAEGVPLGHETAQRPDQGPTRRSALANAASWGALAHGAVLRWQSESARASAASGGFGTALRSRRRATICCTWSFVAAPKPVTASLTSFEVYSATSQPSSTAVKSATPLACPTDIAVRALVWKKTRSTTTTSGCSSVISACSSERSVASRYGTGESRAVVITPAATARLRGPSAPTHP